MSQVVGYKLIKDEDNSTIQQWGGTWGECPNIPNPIMLPNGDHIHAPSLNENYNGYTLQEWKMEDPRFYNSDNTQKSLSDCISVQVNLINYYVSSALQETDWLITRQSEGYKNAPTDILNYRKAVRDHGNNLVNEVKSLTDINSVISWQSHDWPENAAQIAALANSAATATNLPNTITISGA